MHHSLDEMCIREDLVHNKHNGEMVGFTNLGSINNHLADFEQSLVSGHDSSPNLAKTMAVFMVQGLFTSLQFPYVAQAFVKTRCMILYGKLFGG